MPGRLHNNTMICQVASVRFELLLPVLGAILWLSLLQGCAAARHPFPSAAKTAPRSAEQLLRDSNADNVPNERDVCKATPANLAVDSFGCPLALYLHIRVQDGGQSFSQDAALQGRLQKLAALLRANPGTRLFIEAHSAGGTVSVQRRKTQARARELAALLRTDYKVDSRQITAIGYGAGRPLVSNATPEGRGRNKRLELVLKGSRRRAALPGARQAAPARSLTLPAPLTLGFQSGSATPPRRAAQERDALRGLAKFLHAHPQVAVRIEGHTDSVGSRAANQALSQKRTRHVFDALVNEFGVSAARLAVRGYGEEQPVADNGTAQGRGKNRRVRLVCYNQAPNPAREIGYRPLKLGPGMREQTAARHNKARRERKSRIPKSKLSRNSLYEIKVSVRKRRLWLYQLGPAGQKQLVRTYTVATPRPGKPAPWGTGEITRIEFNPWWYPTSSIKRDYYRRKGVRLPDSIPPGRRSNPMGKFKIYLSHGSAFRIHGTNAPSQIGRRVSSGCIRMYNSDGLEMARALSVGTKVTVVQ